ncbi:CPBP family intramembrane metalloprotease [Haliea sp. E1-2-M8]|uniref:CPBP family intramembrane glutamic endopeptidase n=1 Tax=Haliea sp. E1-2-M8 TaxID=3064706 RepID=UPI002723F8B8|nr:CPBP family intramembrane glutamic endopeptidase [Haliea sp. E1-2-M8]MDO8862996.1 CPBP family intramembrane metalloprotease [Haliea sp. E1-2-M8]
MSIFVPGRQREVRSGIRVLYTVVLLVGAMFAPVPFPFKVPLFACLALLIVWAETGSVAPVGLKWPVSLRSTLLWALVTALFVVFILGDIINPIIEWLAGFEADHSGYGALEGNMGAALKLLAYALVSAAIAEEIVYRGFLLHELSALLGTSFASKALAVCIGGVVFAIPHYEQGIVGMISITLVGIGFGFVFFRSGRNLWALMGAHALVDIWGIFGLYKGW